MKIPEEFLNRLRTCVRISDVASKIMKLKREGAEFRAVDNHSLAINDRKGTWKDFANGERGGDVFAFLQTYEKLTFPQAVEQVAKIAGLDVPGGNGRDHVAGKWVPEGEWTYETAEGEPYLLVKRFRTPDGKSYPQYHLEGGKWIKGKPEGPKIPYRLPELLDSDRTEPVFIAEGEKCVDRLRKESLQATCASEGAGKWTSDLNEHFRGRIVWVLPDNDEPGRKHATDVAKNLHSIAKEVKIIDIGEKGLLKEEGEDVVEFFDKYELTTDNLMSLGGKAPPFAPYGQDAKPGKRNDRARLDWKVSGISVKEIRAMKFNPVQFLVSGLIPAEGATLLCSKPKKGKSWLLLDLALASTMNRYTLGDKKPTQGDVLYLALEDNYRRIKQRCEKLLGTFTGEWPEGLRVNLEWRRFDQGGADDIREWVTETRAAGRTVAFVAIDVFQLVRQPGDAKKPYEGDYAAMSAIANLARDLKISIIVVHHVRKAPSEDPLDLISGTMGLVGAADTVLVIGKGLSGTNVLHVRGRDVEEAELAVEFNKNTCRWTILGDAATVTQNDTRAKILAVLRDCAPEAKTPQELTKLTGLKENTLSVSLMRMLKDREIHRPERGKYAFPD